MIERDFWSAGHSDACAPPNLKGHLTFKGGTSLSKTYGIIQRFSENIDLTIRRTAPLLDKVAAPREAGIGSDERSGAERL